MINKNKGFTLIELLIVIGIISVLAVAVVVVINPTELLSQARDSTRLSDLAAINSAIGLYMVDVSNPNLEVSSPAGTADAFCTGDGADGDIGGDWSVATNDIECDENNGTGIAGNNGWVAINFGSMSTGSPLPRLPLDPTNSDTHFYAYATDGAGYSLNANMESTKFGGSDSDDNVENSDGGSNDSIYEVGTDLGLIGW